MNYFTSTRIKQIICFLLPLTIQNLFAQSIIEEKYGNGAVKIRYHLRGKDTFCVEKRLENGWLYAQIWKDSSYYYYENASQTIEKQLFGKPPADLNWLHYSESSIYMSKEPFRDYGMTADSIRVYYPDGNLKEILFWKHDNLGIYRNYLPNGQLFQEVQHAKLSPSKISCIGINGIYMQNTIIDSENQTKKNLIYENNQLIQETDYQVMQISPLHLRGYEPVKRIIKNEAGQITFSWEKDTTEPYIDKDNALCLYGLRNRQGEWVLAPEYESIEYFNQAYYIANKNNKYGILDKHGKIIVPFQWDFLVNLMPSLYDNVIMLPTLEPLLNIETRLVCRKGNLFGVLDALGKTILEPVYQGIKSYKNDLYQVQMGKYWGIVDTNGKTIVAPHFVELEFTAYPDLFTTIDTIPTLDANGLYTEPKKYYGLVDNKNKILINTVFEELKSDTNYSRCFWATVNTPDGDDTPNYKLGLFHAGKGWLLDTNTTSQNSVPSIEPYEIVYQKGKKQQKKYGIYDISEMKFLLEPDYQIIKYFEKLKYIASKITDPQKSVYQKIPLFACCKQKKWGLFDPKQKKWLIPLQYDTLVPFGDSLYWVLYEGKYQFINDRNQLALDEKFDKIGSFDIHHPFSETFGNDNACFVPQRDSMIFYNIHSFPQKTAFSDIFEGGNSFKTFGNGKQKWSLNRYNRLIMSPDYELLMEKDDYLLTQHKVTKKQYLIDNQGNKQLFSSKYLIQWFDANADFVLVADAKTKRFGAVTMDQKMILPCSFFAMATIDSQGVIWARKDFPSAQNAKDYKNIYPNLDSNWQMYDKKGALLTKTVFDYPFLWAANSLGIGQVHGKQGIWNVKGQNILPAQYDKIEYDVAHQVFYLFESINEKHHCIGFASSEGQLIIDKNLLNMSFFDGNNAFVETAAGYGIIQKNGTYLITPEKNAFQKAAFRILPIMFHDRDSLEKGRNTDKYLPALMFFQVEILKSYCLAKPYSPEDTLIEHHLQTLKPPFSQMLVENLMLELILPTYFLNDYTFSNQRSINYYFYFNNQFDYTFHNEHTRPAIRFMNHYISGVSCHDETVHLDWVNRENSFEDDQFICHNYQLKNNIWQNMALKDILVLNEANRVAVNQLLMDKIAALKNQAIDCSNPAAYLKKVENCFHLLPEGLKFFFKDRHTKKVPILLTWAELKPFLKE